jgi:hypothetical protein
VLAALEKKCSGDDPAGARRGRTHRRGLLTLVMIALLVGGVIELLTATSENRPAVDAGSRASIVFSNAQAGTCLSWPPDAPDKPSFVQCRSDHMFEVAKPVGMSSFGEPCQLAVREYLGTRYDPNSRFTISVLWAGDAGETGGRNLLCGLQLVGADGKPTPFRGRIVDLDQSKTWPAGTCLGIDSANRSTDIPVDCAAPHGLEVTGSVSLAERFPGAFPSDADQRAFIVNACTKAADVYLAPATLSASGMTLGYETIPPTSWAAGSRQVSCNVGRPAEQGWAPITGSARNHSPTDLPPPAAPVAAPSAAPSPAPSAPSAPPPSAPPPPVYEEPLSPVGPLPTEAPAAPPPTTATETPAPATSSTAAPTTTAGTPSPPPPSESPAPQPGLLEIPGLPAITLPGYVPPEPPPPAPLGPPPGPVPAG